MTSIRKHTRERNLEARQQRRHQDVPGFAREFNRSSEASAVAPIDADDVGVGIDHPVFDYTDTAVQPAFDRLVTLSRSGRRDLNDDIGRASDVLTCKKFLRSFIRHIKEIRFDDIESREQHVERGVEDAADRMVLQPTANQQIQAARNVLVSDIRDSVT
jgi:hypothetical protein